jgi:hypothetical protein
MWNVLKLRNKRIYFVKKHLTSVVTCIGLLNFIILTGCTKPGSDDGGGSATDYCSAASITPKDEIAECTTNSNYSSPSIITGTAVFYKRNVVLSTSGSGVAGINSMKLGAPTTTALPIKYAEVRVLNSSGDVVQCGRTDSSGALKALDGTTDLNIPNTPGNYTVQVMARTQHDVAVPGGKPAFKFYAAVKDVCSNDVHKITSTVNSTGAGSYPTSLTAYARESESSSVDGGAFNIYNDLAVTYDYLGQNTGNSNLSCLSPKLHVYWTAGFNPAQFIDPFSDPSTLGNISFYLRGYNELYINGGKLGDVSTADTDQFDDAVIIHETGHHLEDVCGKMDSPGGSHYGQFRIDPRLAWSEGWGNFIGAHITRNNLASINPDLATTLSQNSRDGWLYYLDTAGYSDGGGSADEVIRIDLSKPGANPEFLGTSGGYPFYFDKVDATNNPGEGHFREVSISRSLFKSTNTCASGYCSGINNEFAKMWEAFENDPTKSGMGKPAYPFRSSVRFYDRLTFVSSGTLPAAISTMLNTDEAQQLYPNSSYVSGTTTTWVPYAIKLVSTGSTPCNLAIQPRNEDFNVTYFNPDQRYSNHFYYFDRNTLPTVSQIKMTVTKTGGTSTDIDLVLYQDGYSFPAEKCVNSSCTAYVKNTLSTEFVRLDRTTGSGTTYTKQISNLNQLSFSVPYLLNIRAFTSGVTIDPATQYSYTLTDQQGNNLCPSPTF